MAKNEKPLRDLIRELCLPEMGVHELFRRMAEEIKQDQIIITQSLGTFYLRKRKATTRTLNGQVYTVEAKDCLALRGVCDSPTEAVEPEGPVTVIYADSSEEWNSSQTGVDKYFADTDGNFGFQIECRMDTGSQFDATLGTVTYEITGRVHPLADGAEWPLLTWRVEVVESDLPTSHGQIEINQGGGGWDHPITQTWSNNAVDQSAQLNEFYWNMSQSYQVVIPSYGGKRYTARMDASIGWLDDW